MTKTLFREFRFTKAGLLSLAVAVFLPACAHNAPKEDEGAAAKSEQAAASDGISDGSHGFLGSTERFEKRNRDACENEPNGEACWRLYRVTADRYRGGNDNEDAPGAIVFACSQGHEASCAAVEIIRDATQDRVDTLLKIGCPRPDAESCHATASYLAYACNQRQQPAACVGLSKIFEQGHNQHDPAWAKHYKDRACEYGGICPPQPDPEPVQVQAEASE